MLFTISIYSCSLTVPIDLHALFEIGFPWPSSFSFTKYLTYNNVNKHEITKVDLYLGFIVLKVSLGFYCTFSFLYVYMFLNSSFFYILFKLCMVMVHKHNNIQSRISSFCYHYSSIFPIRY